MIRIQAEERYVIDALTQDEIEQLHALMGITTGVELHNLYMAIDDILEGENNFEAVVKDKDMIVIQAKS